ncbi:FtsX-like permease family protein [uncultured Paraglaciecola sp.]|uniref:ABC transporter permease n=1 Tax=uncultured Paraglaciecola sp. TaxID=1765024 RepID=UPI00262AAD58|nr:FtsX-like permease family protein [uncultured Paraglaciecola sp.]
MEFRPIFLSIKHNKAIALLVIIQVAITLTVLSGSLLMTTSTLKEWNLPSGIPQNDIISAVPQFYDPDIDVRQTLVDDLQRIKATPGVINATPITQRPFDAQGTQKVYLQATEEAQEYDTNIFTGDANFHDVLGLTLIEGRFFREDDIIVGNREQLSANPSIVMVSEDMAKVLFPEGDALGQTIWLTKGGSPAEIIGIYSNFMNGERLNAIGKSYHTVLQPLVTWQTRDDPNYLVRVEPGLATGLLETIRNQLYKTKGRYVNQVERLTRTQKRMYDGRGSQAILLLVISFVLLLITAFGMAGLVSFLVTQRQKQIGTRRALGATKWDVVRYFMLENGILSGLGIMIGLALSLLFTFVLTEESGVNILDMSYIFATAFFILLINQLAVFIPAKRAASVAPAIVTRAA